MRIDGPIATGVAVVVGLLLIAWGFRRWGMLGGVCVAILVVVVGGSAVKPIKATAQGVIDTLQAPLTAAEDLLHKGWSK